MNYELNLDNADQLFNQLDDSNTSEIFETPERRAKTRHVSQALTKLRSRITTHFNTNRELHLYYDNYNKKVKFRHKPSSKLSEELFVQPIGHFRDPLAARVGLDIFAAVHDIFDEEEEA